MRWVLHLNLVIDRFKMLTNYLHLVVNCEVFTINKDNVCSGKVSA